MSLTLELDPVQQRDLEILAQSEGMSIIEYAMRRLLPAHAISHGKKPLVLDRYDKTPDRQKTASEIDAIVAGIDADRDSWEERERSAWTAATPSVDSVP